MNRKDALVAIRVAGYHNDQQTLVRSYCENRISYAAAFDEFRRGAAMKRAGVPCSCIDCRRQQEATA